MQSRPYIMIIDDEPQALTAMLDALARRFGGDYEVVSHLQVTTALAQLEKIKQDGHQVALIIGDQWMPETRKYKKQGNSGRIGYHQHVKHP